MTVRCMAKDAVESVSRRQCSDSGSLVNQSYSFSQEKKIFTPN